jgi:hypothetical protein
MWTVYHQRKARRKTKRLSIGQAARLRPDARTRLEVQIVDVSCMGFKGTCEAPLRIRSWLSIEVPGIGPTTAEVRWQQGNRFGAAFVRPIDLDHLSWTPAVRDASPGHLLHE